MEWKLDEKTLELFAMILSIAGQLLMIVKSDIAFILWIISNVVWIRLCLKDGRRYLAATFIIYTLIDIVAFYVWFVNLV